VTDSFNTAEIPVSSGSSDRDPGWRTPVQNGLLALPVLLFVVAGWMRRWMVDDGFIYLRVVQQLTRGNGPVFNTGERVEAFTSPLWVSGLAVADLVAPVRLEWLAVGLGIALSAAGLGLAMAGSATLVRPTAPRALLVPFGALVPISLVPFWIFQTSGLETGLVIGWLGACLFVFARWAESGRSMPWYAATLIGLGWLVRPELLLFSALFLLTTIGVGWAQDSWPARLRIMGAALALPLLYQFFRMGFYGALVSNPAIAKEASSTNWDRGWDYLVDFAAPYWLWFPVLVIVVGGYVPLSLALGRAERRRSIAVVSVFVAAGLVSAVYVISVGGDWMHARLLLPALFAVVAPVAVVPWTRRFAAGVLLLPWVVVAALGLRPPQLDPEASIVDQFILADARNPDVTLDDFGWGPDGPRRQWYEGPGYYFTEGFTSPRLIDLDRVRPSVSLPVASLGGIGLPSYAIGPELTVIDTLGLANTLASHMERQPLPPDAIFERKPGHEKPLPSVWVAALLTPRGARPDPADFPAQVSNAAIPPTAGGEFQEQVAWARAALECPDIRELLQSSTGALGPRRAIRNLIGSSTRTRLRIPPDPEKAFHKFCGPGTPQEVRARRAEPG